MTDSVPELENHRSGLISEIAQLGDFRPGGYLRNQRPLRQSELPLP